MKVLGIIPARMAASRFPNKPMALIEGMPMIGHCYIRSRLSDILDDLYVATCDEVIFDYISQIGGKAVMTSNVHERATERSAEALITIERETNQKFDIVVMIQGDEPLVFPQMINESVNPLLSGNIHVSNLMSKLKDLDDARNPNFVKVVTDNQGKALYLSREAILEFINLPPTRLEIIESVDMNRFLENQVSIQMSITEFEADSVDTIEDLAIVIAKMKKDSLFQKYKFN